MWFVVSLYHFNCASCDGKPPIYLALNQMAKKWINELKGYAQGLFRFRFAFFWIAMLCLIFLFKTFIMSNQSHHNILGYLRLDILCYINISCIDAITFSILRTIINWIKRFVIFILELIQSNHHNTLFSINSLNCFALAWHWKWRKNHQKLQIVNILI